VSDPRYARSFDGVAAQYERARPEYADEAVDWIVEELELEPGSRVLDLAAGTGKLTRQLLRRGLDVVAVEPSDEMRAELVRVLPEVEALAGTAEAIPLPDASVDAVTVGQAFHWFDAKAALAEMRRVLKPHSGIALLWNRWDEEDPLLSQIDALLRDIRPPAVARGEKWEPGPEYERRTFRQRRPMTIDAIVEWAGSTSGWVNAPAEKQRELEMEIRRIGEEHGGEVSIATDVLVGWPNDPHTYKATLRVGSDSLPLAELTRRLGEPTRGWDIDEPVTPRYPERLRTNSVWTLESQLGRQAPLDEHVAPLLDFAELRRAELDELRAECWMDMFCGVFTGDAGQGGFTFEPELIKRLSDLGLAVVFDVY
jgi:ubiquinone/menaquinone biosynthesis C-methylase UbiE